MTPEENKELSLFAAKPAFSGITAAALDRIYFGRNSIGQNLAFGATTAIAVMTADLLGTKLIHNKNPVAKSVEVRATELGLTAVGVYGLEMIEGVAGSSARPRIEAAAVAVVSEVIGEYLQNTFHNYTL